MRTEVQKHIRYLYHCDFCGEVFNDRAECEMHEERVHKRKKTVNLNELYNKLIEAEKSRGISDDKLMAGNRDIRTDVLGWELSKGIPMCPASIVINILKRLSCEGVDLTKEEVKIECSF